MSRRMPGTTLPRLLACAWVAIACSACGPEKTGAPLGEAQAAGTATPRDVYKFLPAKPVASNGKVIGTFTLADGTLTQGKDDTGFESPGTGGACLLGDFSATFKEHACSTKADCTAVLEQFHAAAKDGVALEDRHAYCLATDKSGPKHCWIRPGDYCLRSTSEAWTVDEEQMLPPAPADPLKNGKPVRWIVHACLNGYDVPGAVPGCKSGDPAKSRNWESPVLESQ